MTLRLPTLLLAASALCFSAVPSFRVDGPDPAPWKRIFGSVNIAESTNPSILVLASTDNSEALAANHIVIVENAGTGDPVAIRQIRDIHSGDLPIIWEHPTSAKALNLAPNWTVFAKERWKSAPLLAGKRTAHGALLYMATSPGEMGYERYPFLLQALTDLGLELPVRASSLWAFFDSSYRIRADVDYLAKRWRRSGISVLHVAAWHNMDADTAQDEYLRRLIAACHRNAILVYAWLELPHVSERFWADHPAWREKTAIGQDAQLDWRKLMNLQNRDCRTEAARQITALLDRFDWDGVNLAELYFESPEGAANPARFTPMNDDVRAEYKQISGIDPKSLFAPGAHGLKEFLNFRAALAARMQSDWLKELETVRTRKPYLDIVLTHIDDRFDSTIRDALGADVARALPLMRAHRSTLLVEDPATLWHLGPDRYAKLREKYQAIGATPAVDINIVDRYQDVYPTKKQTGVELTQLIHQAAASFPQVAVYAENSVTAQDIPLLPAAAVDAQLKQPSPDEIVIDTKAPVRIRWDGPVELDGKPWPLTANGFVTVPAGKHRLLPGIAPIPSTIADFNGEIRSALASSNGIDLAYAASSRAILLLSSPAAAVEVDGAPAQVEGKLAVLPSGQHIVTVRR